MMLSKGVSYESGRLLKDGELDVTDVRLRRTIVEGQGGGSRSNSRSRQGLLRHRETRIRTLSNCEGIPSWLPRLVVGIIGVSRRGTGSRPVAIPRRPECRGSEDRLGPDLVAGKSVMGAGRSIPRRAPRGNGAKAVGFPPSSDCTLEGNGR